MDKAKLSLLLWALDHLETIAVNSAEENRPFTEQEASFVGLTLTYAWPLLDPDEEMAPEKEYTTTELSELLAGAVV